MSPGVGGVGEGGATGLAAGATVGQEVQVVLVVRLVTCTREASSRSRLADYDAGEVLALSKGFTGGYLERRVPLVPSGGALLRSVLGQPAPSHEFQSTLEARIARLLGQVLHLHVLDEVALIPDEFLTDEAEVLSAGEQVALGQDEGVGCVGSCDSRV